MKRMLGWILAGLFCLYIVISIISEFLPDWFKIIWNSNPRDIDVALKEAKRTYDYDRENWR